MRFRLAAELSQKQRMMKKITLEKLLLAVFGIILGYVLFGHIENPYAILYNAISYLWMCGMFVYTGLIWIGEPEKKKPKRINARHGSASYSVVESID